MKKLIFAGLAVLLAFALVMCGITPLSENEGNGEEFAEYSPDGKSISIRLEGGSSSRNMSRALTNALAEMNHDFYEVVFFYDSDGPSASAGTVKIARTSWSRGEGAAISVFRGTTPSEGINYGSVDFSSSLAGSSPAPDVGAAILFVGKRTTRGATLLAVGRLVNVADNGSDYPVMPVTIVTSTSSKVVFEIVSLDSSIPYPVTGTVTAADSSFLTKFMGATVTSNALATTWFTDTTATAGPSTVGKDNIASITAATTNDITDANKTAFATQVYQTIEFPLFTITPDPKDNATSVDRYYAGKFTFMTATGTSAITSSADPNHISKYVNGIVIAQPPSTPAHKYLELLPPNVIINSKKVNGAGTNPGVEITMVNNQTADDLLNNEAYFFINALVGGGGLISLSFNIPVYAITKESSDVGVKPIMWSVQPGIENNYLDNGLGLGGAILIGLGDPSDLQLESAFKQ